MSETRYPIFKKLDAEMDGVWTSFEMRQALIEIERRYVALVEAGEQLKKARFTDAYASISALEELYRAIEEAKKP